MSSSTRPAVRFAAYLAVSVAAIALVILFAAAFVGAIELPQAIDLGIVQIRFYAIIIVTAVATAAWFLKTEAAKHSELKDLQIDDALIWVVIPALVGARLWHFVAEYPLYADDPITVLYIWQGGITILGALAGGALGAIIYAKRHGLPWVKLLELGFVFVPLAQIIGRFGNFINQELYGPVTTLPWGMYIRETGMFHHPAFLYEQIGNAILFYFLYKLYKSRGLEGNGRLIATYPMGYSLVRFSVDFIRLDRKILFGLTSPQLTALVVVAVCAAFLLRLRMQTNEQS